MTEETKQEILQKLIYSAQNENKFTLSDLKDYLFAEHVDSDDDVEYFKNQLTKKNLLITDVDDEEEDDFIDEPPTIEEDEEEDDLLVSEDDEDILNDDLDSLTEPDNDSEEDDEDEDDDEEDDDERINDKDSYTKNFILENFSEGSGPMDALASIDEDVEHAVHRPNVLEQIRVRQVLMTQLEFI